MLCLIFRLLFSIFIKMIQKCIFLYHLFVHIKKKPYLCSVKQKKQKDMKNDFEKLSSVQVARMASALEVMLDIMMQQGIGFENDFFAKASTMSLDCLRELKDRKEAQR